MVVKVDPIAFRLGNVFVWPIHIVLPTSKQAYVAAQLQLVFFYRWLTGFFQTQRILAGDPVLLQRHGARLFFALPYFFFPAALRNSASFFYLPPIRFRGWSSFLRRFRRFPRQGRLFWHNRFLLQRWSRTFRGAAYVRTAALLRLLPMMRVFYRCRQHYLLWGRFYRRRRRLFRFSFRRRGKFGLRAFFFPASLLRHSHYRLQRLRFAVGLERLFSQLWQSKIQAQLALVNIFDQFAQTFWFRQKIGKRRLRPRFVHFLQRRATLRSSKKYKKYVPKRRFHMASRRRTRGAKRKGLRYWQSLDYFVRTVRLLAKWWRAPRHIRSTLHRYITCLFFVTSLQREATFVSRWLQWQLERLTKHVALSQKRFLAYCMRGFVCLISLLGWLKGIRLEVRGKINGSTRTLAYLYCYGAPYARSTLQLPFSYAFSEARTYTGLLSVRFWFF